MKRLSIYFVGVVFCLRAISCGASSPFDSWFLRNPAPTPNNLCGIVYGAGKYVAVGAAGTIITSVDGTNWVHQICPTRQQLNAVDYCGGVFMALGNEGTILISSNAVDWVQSESGVADYLNGAAYGNGQYIIAGGGNAQVSTMLSSESGFHWSEVTVDDLYELTGVAFGNGSFVAVGYQSALVSIDGVTWTPREWPTPLGSANNVVFVNGLFEAVGTGIYSSSDGTNWTPGNGWPDNLFGVSYGKGVVVAVGWDSEIYTSVDVTNGVAQICPIFANLQGVAFGAAGFVAVGWGGVILASPDGTNWASTTSSSIADLDDAAYHGGTLVAVGGGGVILASQDGVRWISVNSGTSNGLSGVIYASNQFVAVGGAGTILTSVDGTNWVSRASGTSYPILSIDYGNGQFVAVGTVFSVDRFGDFHWSALVLHSADGAHWITEAPWVGYNFLRIRFLNGEFVIRAEVGPEEAITSTDGVNWTEQDPFTVGLVGYGNGLYVAVTDGGKVTTSTNLVDWAQTYTNSALGSPLNIAYLDGDFIIVGTGGMVICSPDGVNWTAPNTGLSVDLYGCAFGNGHFVVVGDSGSILESAPIMKVTHGAFIPGRGLECVVDGPAGQNCAIEASTNLVNWLPLTTLVLTNGASSFLDSTSGAFPQRFYRATTTGN